jgi:hypothetical protein
MVRDTTGGWDRYQIWKNIKSSGCVKNDKFKDSRGVSDGRGKCSNVVCSRMLYAQKWCVLKNGVCSKMLYAQK